MKSDELMQGAWNKSSAFSLGDVQPQSETIELVVIPTPVDQTPSNVIHVGGSTGNGNC